MKRSLQEIASAISSPVEKRLFVEYGAMFATASVPPPTIVFTDAAEVDAFQSSLRVDRAIVGEHEITLQSDALHALLAAATRTSARGVTISARSADAGARSYEDTVKLWTRNVTRGLDHWQALGRLHAEQAQLILALAPKEQVAAVLELEEHEQILFGTFFDRSILHSVAAPGASQHLSLLAFDVAEYEVEEVETELGRHGWYRTVLNDLPHFTFLGHDRVALPGLGLVHVTHTYGERLYGFWVPEPVRA